MSCFDDFQPDPAELVALDLPRMPTDKERELMEELVAPLGVAELEEQVARAWVVSTCSCGCRSVGLRTDGPAVDPHEVSGVDPEGPGDVLSIGGVRLDDEGAEVEVTLHLVGGRLEELEVWAESLSRS